MSTDTQPHYEPLSIAPAEPGWRAIYRRPADGSLFEAPLVGWGVFHLTHREVRTGRVMSDAGNVLAGVVADRTYPIGTRYITCAESRDAGEFHVYVEPGAAYHPLGGGDGGAGNGAAAAEVAPARENASSPS